MATLPAHAIQELSYAKLETTYKSPLAFAVTDSVLGKLKLEPSQESTSIKEQSGTASPQGKIKGAKGGKWSLECNVKTSGAGVAPNYGDVLMAGMGKETIVGATSVTYALTDVVTHGATTDNIQSLQLGKIAGNGLYEQANGAIVESLKFDFASGSECKVTFSGAYAEHSWIYEGAACTAIEPIGESTIQLDTGEAQYIGENCYVQFDTEYDVGGAGNGYLVTAVDLAADTLTVSPVLDGATEAGDAVLPKLPTHTPIVGNIAGGINCDVTIAGVSLTAISGSVEHTTGLSLREGHVTTNSAVGVKRAERMTKIDIAAELLDENAKFIGGSWNLTERDVAIRLGPNTAAYKTTLNMDATILDVTSIDIPEADVAMVKITGEAQQNSAAADEFNIVMD